MSKSIFSRNKFLVVLLFIIIASGIGYALKDKQETGKDKYKTKTVSRGDIIQAISANGTLNPVVIVNVGTQVSGTVQKLHADFNDHVNNGQILAELDPSLFQAQIAQDQANLLNAESSLKYARIKEQRTQLLTQKNFISAADLDSAKQVRESAQAQVAVAKAQLERNRTNLRYTIIRSPISGVVVARNVDLGQTVAASFQTPTLFQIAQDLSQMQIDTSIAEADVGAVHIGQSVRFTVDSFPDVNFAGTVKQVRLNPTIQQNVVTYNVIVAVNNAEGRLMPGMTAHVFITVAKQENVLRAPNAALRYKPKDEDEPKRSKKESGSTVYQLSPEGKALPVAVKTGITDNTYTEITGGEIKADDKLIIRELSSDKKKDGGFKMRAF
ncbi:efflux RND transporter periplasmic adaptor subunit [Sulfurirhabdus autotrophica]|uniref:HlyD family secretion protein n=1 Tax=Sulfurirhabdus autotrophica TaxID=1706046 RepID=A0A4R3XSA1_9PROT|nr:efflux RND transporter periplasmic adaptor subunit [Sulfurirhabdus autotrophica]TCV82515.1 HlyD family secretion protein [Sulfurirhabdus autotrophica]